MSTSATPPRADGSDEPTVLEMLESVFVLAGGAVVAAPMLPGFTLCIPALAVLAVAILVPVLAAAALATLAGVVVATPYLLVRSVGSVRSRRAARARMTPSVPATGRRAARTTMWPSGMRLPFP